MPLHKAWDTRRRKRKAVTARGFQEFVKGGVWWPMRAIGKSCQMTVHSWILLFYF